MTDQESIKETLKIIRKALEDDSSEKIEIKQNIEENILILNNLVNEDGTINVLKSKLITEKEVKDILKQKIAEVIDLKLDKWLDKNLPEYLNKHFSNK